MKCSCTVLAVLCLAWATANAAVAQAPPPAGNRPWVSVYYLAGDQDNGRLAPQLLDYTAFSHLIHFAVFPGADGSVDPEKGGITSNDSRTTVPLAHAAGRKILLCVASRGTQFVQAIGDGPRSTLVRNLVRLVMARGYDGLDLDFEPLEATDVAHYEKFVRELRACMIAAKPGLLLTTAVADQPALFGRLSLQFDQINLMTYDLSGPWSGFKSWYNAALEDGGARRMQDGTAYPSVRSMVAQFTQAGVPKSKLGIGVAFYGYVWTGVSGPDQSIQGVRVDDSVDYDRIMDTLYKPERYHWDSQAQAPYLSIDSPNPKERTFVSYDDETLCAKKIAFVRQEGLGGVIIWQLSGGYRHNLPEGQRAPLLQSIKRAWLTPSAPLPQTAPTP